MENGKNKDEASNGGAGGKYQEDTKAKKADDKARDRLCREQSVTQFQKGGGELGC